MKGITHAHLVWLGLGVCIRNFYIEGTQKMKRLILIAMVVLLSTSTVLAQDFCKSDFDYNGMVDANDVITFLNEFGRSHFHNPCPPDGADDIVRYWG